MTNTRKIKNGKNIPLYKNIVLNPKNLKSHSSNQKKIIRTNFLKLSHFVVLRGCKKEIYF